MKKNQILFVAIIFLLAAILTLLISGNKNTLQQIPVNVPANTELTDYVKVYSPQSGQKISSPLTVSGEARGTWYFEADFPIVVVDWDGRIIGQKYATAKGDWMTGDFVPFEGSVEFKKPECADGADYCKRGAVIFQKDNPSGLPENDAAVEIPVVFE